jgi:hypothetical protein
VCGTDMLSEKPWLWQPETVTGTALGRALYRLPPALRERFPRVARDAVRRRLGPFAPWEAGFSPVSPHPAAGERAGPPDFVGIGAQKAGTTWWYGLITAHPDVFHPPSLHKERHFFARFATQSFGPEQVQQYHGWFPRPEGKRTGEWTPDYLTQPWVAALLEQAAPDARLLVILRDPVERLVSGLAHDPMLPASHTGSVMSDAVGRGLYASALRRWSKPREAGRLLVLQYERCVAEPAAELSRTYRFLGIDDTYRPAALAGAHTPTTRARPVLDDDARRRLVRLYADDVAELCAMVPELDIGLWPNFASR